MENFIFRAVKTVYGGGKKSSNLKIQKQSENNRIKNMRNLFKLKKIKYSNKTQKNQRY